MRKYPMRKWILIIIICSCAMLFFNTSSKQAKEAKRWEIAIPCAENSKGSYVITYIEEKITSTTGILTIKNGNDFDIIVHLFADGKERTQEIKAGGNYFT